jgi:serine/threonine-protein kinase
MARVGPYRVVGALGKGGMGAVLRVEDPSGRPLALKLLASDAPSARALERFRREGELTAALRHPNVVAIHDAGQDHGRPYLVYELVEGQSLDQAWPRLSREQLLDALVEAGRGLGHAHARGVLHRDVKAANILLGEDGRARVADFGLATAAGLERLTRTGATVGTPFTMAPEQVAGERQSYGPHTDVWALGVLLYRALTGDHPFDSESFTSLATAIVSVDPAPPRARDPSVSPALEAVCLLALSKEPEDRPPHGAAFADALAAARRGVAPTTPVQRPVWGALALGFAAALLSAALILGAVLAREGAAAAALERHQGWEREAVEPLALGLLGDGGFTPADLHARRQTLTAVAQTLPEEAQPHLNRLDALALVLGHRAGRPVELPPPTPTLHPDLATARALVLLERGDAKGALSQLERVLRRNPSHRPARLASLAARPPSLLIEEAAGGNPDAQVVLAARWPRLLPPLVEAAASSPEAVEELRRLARGLADSQGASELGAATRRALDVARATWAAGLQRGLEDEDWKRLVDRLEGVLDATGAGRAAPAFSSSCAQVLHAFAEKVDGADLGGLDRARAFRLVQAEVRLHYRCDDLAPPPRYSALLRSLLALVSLEATPQEQLDWALAAARCGENLHLRALARPVKDPNMVVTWSQQHPDSQAGYFLQVTHLHLRPRTSPSPRAAAAVVALLERGLSAPDLDVQPHHRAEAWLRLARARAVLLKEAPPGSQDPELALEAARKALAGAGRRIDLLTLALAVRQELQAWTAGLTACLESWPEALERFERVAADAPRFDPDSGSVARQRSLLLARYAEDLEQAGHHTTAFDVTARAFTEQLRDGAVLAHDDPGFNAHATNLTCAAARRGLAASRSQDVIALLQPHLETLLRSQTYARDASETLRLLVEAHRKAGAAETATELLQRARAAFPGQLSPDAQR